MGGFDTMQRVIRRAGRLILILASPGLLLLLPARAAVPALAATFDLSAQVGWPGTSAQPDDWYPVVATVTNHGGDFRGTLEVDPTSGRGSSGTTWSGVLAGPVGEAVEHRIDVTLPAGSTRRYTLWTTGAGLSVVLRDAGGGAVAADYAAGAAVPVRSGGLFAALVADSRDALAGLSAVAPTGQSYFVAHLQPADLPDSGVLLRGFQVIVLDGATTDGLTASQRSALQDWVHAGGGLLLAGGSSWRRTLAGLPAGLAPVSVGGVRDLSSLPALAALLGANPVSGQIPVAVATPAAGAATLISDGGVPLLVEATEGQGRVLFAAFDPDAEPLASWSGQRSLLRQALGRLDPRAALTLGGLTPYGSNGTRAGTITQALSDSPNLDLPSVPLLGLGLVLYILLAGPVTYAVLKRVGRRDLAWLTIPALVLVVSAAAYGLGIRGKGAALVDRVRLVMADDSGRDYVETYVGVFVPSRGSHVVSPGGGGLVSDVSGQSGFNGGGFVPATCCFNGNRTALGSATVVGGGGEAEIRLDDVPAFTLRPYATQGFESLGGVSQEVTLGGGSLSGTVVSHLPFDLEDARVIAGGSWTPLGTLRQGVPASISLSGVSAAPVAKPVNGGGDLAQQMFPDMYGANREHTREGRTVSALFPCCQYDDQSPYLIGWTHAGIGPLTVDGSPAPLTDLTMVVVPLHPTIARGRAFAAGDLPLDLVDLSATAFAGNRGTVSSFALPAGASAVYEARLPGGGWRDLSLQVSHQNGGYYVNGTFVCTSLVNPGGPPKVNPAPGGTGSASGFGQVQAIVPLPAPAPVPLPGGCGSAVTLEVFDFATSAWVPEKLSSAASQDTADLGPARDLVSPAGLMEIRLRAGSSQSGQIESVSLAGTAL
jgi:hypothetical protein